MQKNIKNTSRFFYINVLEQDLNMFDLEGDEQHWSLKRQIITACLVLDTDKKGAAEPWPNYRPYGTNFYRLCRTARFYKLSAHQGIPERQPASKEDRQCLGSPFLCFISTSASHLNCQLKNRIKNTSLSQ